MKIFIVCSNLRFGGAERVAAILANGFYDRRYEVIIVTNLFEKINYPLNQGIITEDLVSTNDNIIKKWVSSIFLLRKQIKHHQPDVVIAIMRTCGMISKFATIGTKVKVIMTEHNSFERPDSAPFPFTEKFFKFHINKIYKHITVLTEADKKVIGNKFNEVTVMPNPLCLKPIEEFPTKEKIVLAAGRVDGWHVKGFDVLIKSWKKIQDLNDNVNDDDNLRDWWLKIAGDGKKESFEYLMNLLPDGEWKNLNDNDDDNDDDIKSGIWRSEKYRIEFLGFRKDIEELYKKSEIFVLSSRYEGFGLVLIEAMSQGCAPVACDYKGRQREILNPSSALPEGEGEPNRKIGITENGILCEPDDVKALASALKKMMEDEEYREKVHQNAVERSKFYSMENTMNRWENLLKNI